MRAFKFSVGSAPRRRTIGHYTTVGQSTQHQRHRTAHGLRLPQRGDIHSPWAIGSSVRASSRWQIRSSDDAKRTCGCSVGCCVLLKVLPSPNRHSASACASQGAGLHHHCRLT